MTTQASTAELVAGLPELYQPVYGHPALSGQASRVTEDRVAAIRRVVAALGRRLGRPPRVFDLGSAQGYISLCLAADSCEVKGIDYSPENIALAQHLASEHPDLHATFVLSTVESALASLEPGACDLVLGLSVFHHLVHSYGTQHVTGFLRELAPKVQAGLFELALKPEPLYWAASLPDDEQEVLSGFSFVHELTRFPTHLSEIKRPLLFASNRFWYFDTECEVFTNIKCQSHSLSGNVHAGTRKYFFGDGKMAKRFRLGGHVAKANQHELERESEFLAGYAAKMGYPALIEAGASEGEAWLVRVAMPGELLLDAIQDGREYDPSRVIRDVLVQLAQLESEGLFHNDVAVWNTLLKPDCGATLIDFGAISACPTNLAWPTDLLQAFIQFVRDVVTREVPRAVPIRRPFISPFNLPAQYRLWLSQTWSSVASGWSPRRLLDTFDLTVKEKALEAPPIPAIESWIGAMEEYSDRIGSLLQEAADQQATSLRASSAASAQQSALLADLVATTQRLTETHVAAEKRLAAIEKSLSETQVAEAALQCRLTCTTDELANERRARAVDEARITKLEENIAAVNASLVDTILGKLKGLRRKSSL